MYYLKKIQYCMHARLLNVRRIQINKEKIALAAFTVLQMHTVHRTTRRCSFACVDTLTLISFFLRSISLWSAPFTYASTSPFHLRSLFIPYMYRTHTYSQITKEFYILVP